ncbi:MAG: ABC transporter permease [Lachnospiraceae bacterium]|nr:ABC transporter permease [Lachnospiraceae bacterium]
MPDEKTVQMLLEGIRDTLYMTLTSTALAYLLGLPLGILLTLSRKDGLKPNRVIYGILGTVCNTVRSVPFLILLIVLIPFTRALVGRSYGSTATIVPLVICAAPYVARVVEASLNEVDPGVIEAARAMGASNLQIVFRVLLVEGKTSLLAGATITTGILLGYSAMSGTVGGGGLGDIAVRYGYYRWQTDIMVITVVLLIVIFQLIQSFGNGIVKLTDHRKR